MSNSIEVINLTKIYNLKKRINSFNNKKWVNINESIEGAQHQCNRWYSFGYNSDKRAFVVGSGGGGARWRAGDPDRS